MNTENSPSNIANLNVRTLQYRLEHKYSKSTKLDILRKMNMQINKSYLNLKRRGVETSFTNYYERFRTFEPGISSDKIYKNASEDTMNKAIMEAQHMYNMQTRKWGGELARRKHSIEMLYKKLKPNSSTSSSDFAKFKRAIGFAPSRGQYGDEFFNLLSRASDSIHNSSVYYADGRGGVMGALVREIIENDIDIKNADWNTIIQKVNDRILRRGSIPVVEDPDEDFNA